MIKVNQLSKCYRIYNDPVDRLKQVILGRKRQYYKEFWPLKDINFTVSRGETVGIIGANGSGKSTLLQVICGILSPTSGGVEVNGRIAALLELGSGFNPEFTGLDNLFMNAALLGLSQEEINLRYQDIIEFAGIGEFLYQPVKTYSSGMVVRLAFAISSFVNADVLVVDEALSVGDASFQAKCLDRMEQLMRQGTTVLLVTHDSQMVKQYCDRVLYLREGRLVYDGAPEEGTEIYLSESKERSISSIGLTRKEVQGASLAFGSKFGEILKAKLITQKENGKSIVVQQGERVELEIEVKVEAEVCNPRVQMTLRDHRGYNIYAFNDRYGKLPLVRDVNNVIKIKFGFDAKLQVGNYAITVRLDEVASVNDVKMIDKQVGLVDFVVSAPAKTFEAIVDLNGTCT